jgi:hypothetical protein
MPPVSVYRFVLNYFSFIHAPVDGGFMGNEGRRPAGPTAGIGERAGREKREKKELAEGEERSREGRVSRVTVAELSPPTTRRGGRALATSHTSRASSRQRARVVTEKLRHARNPERPNVQTRESLFRLRLKEVRHSAREHLPQEEVRKSLRKPLLSLDIWEQLIDERSNKDQTTTMADGELFERDEPAAESARRPNGRPARRTRVCSLVAAGSRCGLNCGQQVRYKL